MASDGAHLLPHVLSSPPGEGAAWANLLVTAEPAARVRDNYQPGSLGDLQPHDSNCKFLVLLLKSRLKAARTGR